MYGTPAGVAALAKTWTSDGEFTNVECLDCLQDVITNPTLDEVNNWLDQLSATMDVALAGEGFVVPVTSTNAVKAIDMIIEQLCADLVNFANGSGRFFTDRALAAGTVPMFVVRQDIMAWANSQAAGLEGAGATRNASPGDSIGTKEGTAIFQRDAFGNKFENWNNS